MEEVIGFKNNQACGLR